jgi:hypothetical protein
MRLVVVVVCRVIVGVFIARGTVIVEVFSRQLIVQNEHFWVLLSLFLQFLYKIYCRLACVMRKRSAFFGYNCVGLVCGSETLLFETVPSV